MKNLLYTAFIILIAAACKPGIPKDIIQPDEMALILHDIHIVDGYVTSNPAMNKFKLDSSKIIAASYYRGIYKKYGVDSAIYNKSMDYYFTDPKALDAIYDKVTKTLTKQRTAIITADSLKNAKIANIARMKIRRDSINKADSVFWATLLLRDTTKVADSLKKKVDIIKPKMVFKD